MASGAGCMGRAKGRHLSAHSGNVYHAYTRRESSKRAGLQIYSSGTSTKEITCTTEPNASPEGTSAFREEGGKPAAGRVSIGRSGGTLSMRPDCPDNRHSIQLSVNQISGTRWPLQVPWQCNSSLSASSSYRCRPARLPSVPSYALLSHLDDLGGGHGGVGADQADFAVGDRDSDVLAQQGGQHIAVSQVGRQGGDAGHHVVAVGRSEGAGGRPSMSWLARQCMAQRPCGKGKVREAI